MEVITGEHHTAAAAAAALAVATFPAISTAAIVHGMDSDAAALRRADVQRQPGRTAAIAIATTAATATITTATTTITERNTFNSWPLPILPAPSRAESPPGRAPARGGAYGDRERRGEVAEPRHQ